MFVYFYFPEETCVMVARQWISFVFFAFLGVVNAKVYMMDPHILQSMLPSLNSSQEANSETNESSEEAIESNSASNDDARRDDDEDEPILRTGHIAINKHNHVSHSLQAKSEKVHAQHQKRLTELMEFLETHMLSTIYFHEEMKRILEQRKVKDSLRKMVTILEHEPALKEKVLACYKEHLSRIKMTRDVWSVPPNDLVINYVYDY